MMQPIQLTPVDGDFIEDRIADYERLIHDLAKEHDWMLMIDDNEEIIVSPAMVWSEEKGYYLNLSKLDIMNDSVVDIPPGWTPEQIGELFDKDYGYTVYFAKKMGEQ